MKNFYSNGKLLITGEYAVLNGAKALTVPTKYGQESDIEEAPSGKIEWQSFNDKGEIWYSGTFGIKREEIKCTSENLNSEVTERLLQILRAANKMNPAILQASGYHVETRLNFDRNWGLGTSSTLINNIAQWFEIDAYKLLEKTFGGSGFDIAAAQHNSPLTYQIGQNERQVLKAHFDPDFKDEIFFVYLNRKQNSRQAIAHFRNQPQENMDVLIEKISNLTLQFIDCTEISEFEMLMEIHETLISKVIQLPKVKTDLFKDYSRKIKSLGGWGGDFIMATGGAEEKAYFRKKGYEIIISYEDMVL
ncbi:GYDIA family GHMP kinase [Zunongwangia sp. F363]|uniref:GYDIA family GHMP kinase n=1 Tax=Autumnicola tepida TaxID=3075595 RepID=A0ABU3CBF4_9FLAO|nr:GYDIA family GHMP kinase [Zunongwangia sp. F363]MDT0643672.1 GYDIA family GHMP kinase [Zunongwangia sp. F363]